MKIPHSIKFTDIEVHPSDLSRETKGIIPQTWTRVQFTMPGDWLQIEKVQQWLKDNTADEWATHNFISDNKSFERTVVVRFRDKNDALMFKLRGGHQCWQDNN